MSDISEFLQSYNKTLRQKIAGVGMPAGLAERFTFDSCVKKQDGREVYFATQKSDGQRAVIRAANTDSGKNVAA